MEHRAYVCGLCAEAHRCLGEAIARVMPAGEDDPDAIDVLERHLPEGIPRGGRAEEREAFVRAKYEALAFLYPRGPLRGAPRPPRRFVEWFCVVGVAGGSGLGERAAVVLERHPREDSPGSEFPREVAAFAYPDGCRASETQEAPAARSFALTLTNGERLHVHALAFHEAGGEEGLYLPKCLLIVSRHPFYPCFHSLLTQLYRISLTVSPLPIERYVQHFVEELPLPPSNVRLQFGYIETIALSRPPPDGLPEFHLSYEPLFALLSVENVLTVLGLLLEETRVVLCSSSYAVLAPLCEALLSLLFPFAWQGAYMPLLPSSMLDFLHAPCPFFAGIHSRYLREGTERPPGVVFVDLDEDCVHLGTDEGGHPRTCPALPCEALELRRALEGFSSRSYLTCWSGRGKMTSGRDDAPIPDARKGVEGRRRRSTTDLQSANRMYGGRRAHLKKAHLAFPEKEYLKPVDFFIAERGTMVEGNRNPCDMNRSKRNSLSPPPSDSVSPRPTNSLSPRSTLPSSHEMEVRRAFLWFFASVFQNYEKFLLAKDYDPADSNTFSSVSGPSFAFQSREFVEDVANLSERQKPHLAQVLKTQLFAEFLCEKMETPSSTAFFDESIAFQKIRSKFTSKRPLFPHHSRAGTFLPPPPSDRDLPRDCYSYSRFPSLDPTLFGTTRPPKTWDGDSVPRVPARQTPQNHQRLQWALATISRRRDILRQHTRDPADVLREAQGIINDARRAQLLVLSALIRLQSNFRMLRALASHRRLRNAALSLQRQVRIRSGRRQRQRAAADLLQRRARTWLARRALLRCRGAMARLQAGCRGRALRRILRFVRQSATRCQAAARGFLARRRFALLVQDLSARLREEVVVRWRDHNVCLLYRSAFWKRLDGTSLWHLGVWEHEARRRHDDVAALVARDCGRTLLPDPPSPDERLRANIVASIPPRSRDEHFAAFGLLGEKKRKEKLAAALWSSRDAADLSGALVRASIDESSARAYAREAHNVQAGIDAYLRCRAGEAVRGLARGLAERRPDRDGGAGAACALFRRMARPGNGTG